MLCPALNGVASPRVCTMGHGPAWGCIVRTAKRGNANCTDLTTAHALIARLPLLIRYMCDATAVDFRGCETDAYVTSPERAGLGPGRADALEPRPCAHVSMERRIGRADAF